MPNQKNRWRPSRRHIFWTALAVLLALLLGPLLLNLLLGNRRIKGALVARLERSFGRPVEVGNFTVSLLGGARIEANYVTVAEDARFGHEFFLRAERITASIRVRSLLAGRIEFGTLSMFRPSLNVVRNAAGLWNVIAWLPASGAARAAPRNGPPAPRLYRIEVDAGRINFKQGADKHPFAFTEVSGSLSQGEDGGWQLDFESQPFRAGAMAQTPGLVRVRGKVGGRRSRIVPADLRVTWDKAAMADVLRLTRGKDTGIRGELGADLRIRAGQLEQPANAVWSVSGSARIEGFHGADLPPRSSDPALNFKIDAEWHPAEGRVTVKEALLETANSSLRATGEVDWSRTPRQQALLRFVSPGISLADLFAAYRAWRVGVSQDVKVEGSIGLEAELQGWPLRPERLLISSAGAQINIPGVASPFGVGRSSMRFNARTRELEIGPVPIALSTSAPARAARPAVGPGALRLDGFLRWEASLPAEFKLSGQVRTARDLQIAGTALGLHFVSAWNTAGWDLHGPAAIKLLWRGTGFPFAFSPEGSIETRSATLHSPMFVEPARVDTLRIQFGKPFRVSVTSAEAFGGVWTGVFTAQTLRHWEVALSTPRFDAKEFVRWTGPTSEFADIGKARSASARITGGVTVSLQIPSPILQALRREDLVPALTLRGPSRSVRKIAGTLAAPGVTISNHEPR